MTKNTSEVNFSQGRALCKIAGEYPTLYEVIMESVQNAIDAGATDIEILLNRKNCNIVIHDNGCGVGMADFQNALNRVCESVKERGKLGQFGIGLISPLGKCARFTFTSCPKGLAAPYVEWTFETEKIREQSDQVTVPHRTRNDLVHVSGHGGGHRRGITPVEWRTEVAIYGYTKDKVVNRIQGADALLEGITERYGAAMRRNDVKVGIAIINEDGTQDLKTGKAKRWSGKKLEERKVNNYHGGDTTVRLYLAKKTDKGYQGQVMMGEADNDFRIRLSQFGKSAGQLIDADVVEVLSSGIFEGEILTQKARLHENRRSFVQNEGLLGFCEGIDEWFRQHGKRYYDDAQEQQEDQRYQDLGLRSMKNIESLLRDPMFADVLDVVGKFKRGSIGDGHQAPAGASVLGKQKEKSIAIGGNPNGHEGSDTKERQPAENLSNHHPYTVAGPSGRHRTVVKSDSLGLQFSHTAMEGSDKLFVLDTLNGILHFNIRHPIWVACDRDGKGNREIMQLQEFVTIQALLLETRPDEWRKVNDFYVEDMLKPMAHLICMSGAYRVIGRPAKAAEN